jgi:WhiB family transcriptional regulator, redox-sensing transcriptional regulator
MSKTRGESTMQWPGTTAVLEKAAPQECESAEESMARNVIGPASASDVIGPASAGTEITMADVLGGLDVPCQDDPELFFAEAPCDVEFAKSLCMGCAARMACLAGAIERREPWGVWGGELFLRGEVVPYKRPRGRPRKTIVAA